MVDAWSPIESWSFSSEKSDSPWRLIGCHVPTEPWRTARSNSGTFQIPVDSSQETSGGGRMVFASRILKIHHHPAPTRGHTMKFLRRPDLDAQTRIHIVMLAWLHQGVYGKMTEMANAYRISRTLLYPLLVMAHLPWETLFNSASILKALEYHPNAVGSLSQCFHSAGQTLPSTLVIPSKKWGFYLSDEIFAIPAPILVTIDARSTTILNIELASDRSADTWSAHVAALEDHQCFSLGMASDRGLGLGAGYQTACDMALWVADYFHEFRDLCEGLHHLARKASAAIGTEDDAAHKFARAKSEANLAKRLQPSDPAQQVCEQAMALYDHLAILLHLLREALQLCSPQGRRRPVENVRSELSLLFDMIAALDCAAMTHTFKPIRQPIDAMVVPFQQAEAIAAELRAVVPHDACDFFWLACAAGLLGNEFATLKALVFDKLDTIVRASSLVEMVHALLRPYLHSCKGQITQEAVNLIMFYHNHRRYKSGKRQGKAPIALLTGKPMEAPWWELLCQRVTTEQAVTDPRPLPTRPPLQLVTNNDRGREQQALASDQAIIAPTGAAEHDRRHKDSKAA